MEMKQRDNKLVERGVRFLPWVGDRYDKSRFGVRLLVLGESHYGGQHSDQNTTREVIEDCAQGKGRLRFFTVIANVLRGQGGWIEGSEIAEIFQEIAFYNFVQTLVGDKPRCRPTFQQWVAAREPFKVVLKELEPDAVLVLGFELRDHIPEWPGNVEWAAIRHPAGALRYKKALSTLQGLIMRAGGAHQHVGIASNCS